MLSSDYLKIIKEEKMKKIQKKIIKTILLSAGILSLVACGGNSSGSKVTSDSNGTTPDTPLVDSTAPIFTSDISFSMTENERTNFVLSATDENEITYSISEGDASSFTIDETTGEVSLIALPNYERQSSYSFTATATDSESNVATQAITVTVVDVEESAGKFVITVKTDNTGDSSAVEFTIPTNTTAYPAGYTYNVDCDNDGENESTGVTENYTCQYDSAGTYSIAIEGNFPQMYFNNTGDKDKLISVDQWGTNIWKSMSRSFRGCSNLEGQASDNPNLSDVTSMNSTFSGASKFDQNISQWDVSNVTDMYAMFAGANTFNQDIGSWNVVNVTNMSTMFAGASSFNQDIGHWKIYNVTGMTWMFLDASSFDQDLSAWQPYAATDMGGMFTGVTLSPENYKSLLVGWAFKKSRLQNGVNFSAGNSKIPFTTITIRGVSRNIPDSDATDARAELRSGGVGPGWTIIDGDAL